MEINVTLEDFKQIPESIRDLLANLTMRRANQESKQIIEGFLEQFEEDHKADYLIASVLSKFIVNSINSFGKESEITGKKAILIIRDCLKKQYDDVDEIIKECEQEAA
jgi:predicted Zn-dependent protease with MMP-like domain